MAGSTKAWLTSMSPDDARLVAALTVLRDQLAPVVDELTFGELTADDRRVLARALRLVADNLEPKTQMGQLVVGPVT